MILADAHFAGSGLVVAILIAVLVAALVFFICQLFLPQPYAASVALIVLLLMLLL